MSNFSLTDEEIRILANKIRLRRLYEDDEIVLMTAPNEDELRQIILELLQERPMNLREIHTILSGLASEDKIRKALNTLVNEGTIAMNTDGRYVALSY